MYDKEEYKCDCAPGFGGTHCENIIRGKLRKHQRLNLGLILQKNIQLYSQLKKYYFAHLSTGNSCADALKNGGKRDGVYELVAKKQRFKVSHTQPFAPNKVSRSVTC